MGLYLAAATLNQALLARGPRARRPARLGWPRPPASSSSCSLPGFDDRVLQVEVGYLGAAVVLAGLLYALRSELAYQRREGLVQIEDGIDG